MPHLYRSTRDKKVFGLCGGLAESFNVDATLLRLIVVITTFFSGGAVAFLYVIASLVVPKESHYDPFHTAPFSDSAASSFQRSNPDSRPFGTASAKRDPIDDMMEDIEKKALRKEIEELRKKLEDYEKKEKGEH